MKLPPLAFTALAALLCSCAATSVKQTWKSPDSPGPVGKVAVVAVAEYGNLRIGLENRFVRQLTKAGSTATATYDLLSLPQIKADKQAAAARFRANGAEGVLILRLANLSSSYRENRPGRERYAGMITDVNSIGWYETFTVGFTDMSPTYAHSKETVNLETSLYDLNTEKRLWSGVTQTVVTEDMDRVAEMDPLIEKIVAAMKKDGVIP